MIAWSTAPLLDEAGNVRNIICGGLDVTERKQHEIELDRERDFLSKVTDITPSLLVVVDDDARVVEDAVNESFVKVTGWSEIEMRGRSFAELFHEDDRYFAAIGVASAFNGVDPQLRLSRWVHANGRRPRDRVDGDADRGHSRPRARARVRCRRDRAGAARARSPLQRGAAARDDRSFAGGRARGRPRRPDRTLESCRRADVRLVRGGDDRRPAPAHPGRGARGARRADDPRPLGRDLYRDRGQAALQGRQPDRRRDLGRADPRCVGLGDQPPGAVRGHQRSQAPGGGAPRLARPHRQGGRRGEAPAGAEPPRRRSAAAGRALALAPPRPGEGRQRPAGRRGGARVGARGARRSARRAARARARNPSRRPHRPGSRRRARGARLALADPGRDRDAGGRAAAGRRGRRVLRDRGGARERDQVRPRVRGRTCG